MKPNATARLGVSSGHSAWGILRDSATIDLAGRLARSYARTLVVRHLGAPEWRTRFGLELDAGWQKTPVEKGLVVFIHGYQSLPERHSDILKDVRAAGIPCALLRYPNDQPLDKSAALLAQELRSVAAAQPHRQITILALSMGGLIARAAIENSALDPGNVVRLLMVATPNQGSRMAQFTVGADLWEFLVRRRDGSLTKRLYASVEDGLGEAAEDLRPDSDFLRTLNARKRNSKVQYALFLGSGGPVDEKSLERWRERSLQMSERSHTVRFIIDEIGHSLEDLDEILVGKGDGAVAVERGRLEGVEDTTLFAFRHHQLMDADTEPSRQLRAELLKRLTK
jgi:pimeloyl-ACP methyl ester carboxylesterase